MRLKDLAVTGIFTAFIVLCSWVNISNGAVPFTLQLLAVYLIATVLEARNANLCLAIYIIVGAVGVPVFAGFTGGVSHILGSTGGFIVSFLTITPIYTLIMLPFKNQKKHRSLCKFLACFVGLVVCYVIGVAWAKYISGSTASLSRLLEVCVLPFIVPDIIKILCAIFISNRIKKFVYR